MKREIQVFLKKHKMESVELARLAGLDRWSLRRYLTIKDTGITLKTAEKLQKAMRKRERLYPNA